MVIINAITIPLPILFINGNNKYLAACIKMTKHQNAQHYAYKKRFPCFSEIIFM